MCLLFEMTQLSRKINSFLLDYTAINLPQFLVILTGVLVLEPISITDESCPASHLQQGTGQLQQP